MTFDEIKQIPDLQIEVDELTEQCFYLKMALTERISDDAGRKILDNIKGKYTESEYKAALDKADRMIRNIDTYGVACAEWI